MPHLGEKKRIAEYSTISALNDCGLAFGEFRESGFVETPKKNCVDVIPASGQQLHFLDSVQQCSVWTAHLGCFDSAEYWVPVNLAPFSAAHRRQETSVVVVRTYDGGGFRMAVN